MSEIRYERNSAGIEEVLLAEPMAQHMAELAADGAAYAEVLAEDFRRTGRYATSVHAEPGSDPFPSPRAVGHVIVDVPYALEVEDRHHTLNRVVDYLENQ